MGSVTMEYEETVVERRIRKVRVEDLEGGAVSAWHGGLRLRDLSAWTSYDRAVEDARQKAEAFGVGPDSSLSIRVERTVTRNWSYPDARESGRPRPDKILARRQVLDVVHGELPFVDGTMRFRVSAWVGVPVGEDPTPYLPFFADVEVAHFPDRLLFAGYGFGEIRCGRPFLSGSDAAPPDPRKGKSYHRVALEGTLPVQVPRGGSLPVMASGGMWLRLLNEWGAIPEELRGRGDFVCPHGDYRLDPAPALPAPAAAA